MNKLYANPSSGNIGILISKQKNNFQVTKLNKVTDPLLLCCIDIYHIVLIIDA